ncbi:MAG TPA: tripartite tricarboxylate transporter substrate binding protein [Burkholderiales bacterium]|nr:tripartite tricarboxylate transporter substrate binding protein [Burkholderiales bacterium]
MTRLLAFCAAALMADAAAAAERGASGYPSRPIRFLLGQAPGGGQDIIARALAQRLTETLGQTVIVDNRPGASGTLAAALAAKAAPDGYTALGVSITYSIVPALYRSLPFDPVKDLQPVTQIASTPFVLLVQPALPVRSVKELIAYAKERPRELNYASGGVGNSGHLAAALFASLAGVQLTHIPYKGTGLAMPDLLSGRVQLLFNSMIQGLPYAQRRQLNALAVTTARRSALLPDLPTMAEAGVPGYEFQSWYGLMVPAGTAKAIIAGLSTAAARTVALPDFKRHLAADGSDAVGSTPEAFAVFLKSEMARWGEVVKSSGMKAE